MRENRRQFLRTSVAAATLSALNMSGAAESPNERLRVAVLGVHGRGRQLATGFSKLPNVEVAYLCDPDLNIVPRAMASIKKAGKQTTEPKIEQDFRNVLERKDVDALIVATPDHWHALATIWGCQNNKHVYVEKPISHNIIEGRKMLEAARKYKRVVQVGTQRRSGAHFKSAVDFVQAGKLGKVPFARTWIAGNRPNIGKKKNAKVPKGVDYNLWLGPAPERPFHPNHFHYNWHWQWEYGTGELGNNGIHALDVARWLLNVDAPNRVTSGGGMHFYDDDRVTPDTQIATYDFDDCTLVWEHRFWSKTGFAGESWGVALYGEKGTMIFDKKGWHVEDGIEASEKSSSYEVEHYQNFVDCIHDNKRPNADIEVGHLSTRLCHLGNIAYRTGHTLHFDAKTETMKNNTKANALLGRNYRKPFALPKEI